MIAMYSPGQRPCGTSMTFSFHLAKSCTLTHSRLSTKHLHGVGHWPVAHWINEWALLRNNLLPPPVRLSQCCLIDTDISTWCSFSRSTCVLSAGMAWYHDDGQQQALNIRQAGRKPKAWVTGSIWMLALPRQWSLKTVPRLLSDVQFRFLHVGESEA